VAAAAWLREDRLAASAEQACARCCSGFRSARRRSGAWQWRVSRPPTAGDARCSRQTRRAHSPTGSEGQARHAWALCTHTCSSQRTYVGDARRGEVGGRPLRRASVHAPHSDALAVSLAMSLERPLTPMLTCASALAITRCSLALNTCHLRPAPTRGKRYIMGRHVDAAMIEPRRRHGSLPACPGRRS